MAVRKLTTSTIENNVWYKSMLAGNAAFIPSSFDLLETQILSTTAASVTFTGLDTLAAGYKHLQIRMVTSTNGADESLIRMQINSDTGSNYARHFLIGTGSAVNSAATTSTTALPLGTHATDDVANSFGASVVDILDFANTNKNTTIRALGGHAAGGSLGTFHSIALVSGVFLNTAAVTSLQIFPQTDSFITGSRFSLYGVK